MTPLPNIGHQRCGSSIATILADIGTRNQPVLNRAPTPNPSLFAVTILLHQAATIVPLDADLDVVGPVPKLVGQ